MPKKLENYKWLCSEPFTNVMNSIGGKIKPCCHIITENWNEDFASFRQEFIEGGGPLIDSCCIRCIEQEKHSTTSFRKEHLQNFISGKFSHKKEELEKYLETDFEESFILTMEYKAQDNFCNLKCNMCKPILSSTLARENVKLGKELHPIMNNNPHFVTKRDDLFDDYFENLLELKLVGGETLAIKENYDIMEQCNENLILQITTNATLTPKFNGKDIFDFIPKFKEVHMNVSIEFWGEKNNYLRFPSKWETIMNNVEKFKKFSNVIVNYHPTLNALNIGYMLDIINKVDNVSLDNLVYGPKEIYSIESVPFDIREKYIDNYYNNWSDKVDHLISYLENMSWNENQMWEMLKDIKDRDVFRNTCLIEVLPEWKSYYENISS